MASPLFRYLRPVLWSCSIMNASFQLACRNRLNDAISILLKHKADPSIAEGYSPISLSSSSSPPSLLLPLLSALRILASSRFFTTRHLCSEHQILLQDCPNAHYVFALRSERRLSRLISVVAFGCFLFLFLV